MKNTYSDFRNFLLARSETSICILRSESHKTRQRIVAQGRTSLIFYKLQFWKGWKLQRTNQNIFQLVNHIDSFRRKLQVLKSHHLNDNIFHFFCQILLEEHDNNCNFKEYILFSKFSYRRIWRRLLASKNSELN